MAVLPYPTRTHRRTLFEPLALVLAVLGVLVVMEVPVSAETRVESRWMVLGTGNAETCTNHSVLRSCPTGSNLPTRATLPCCHPPCIFPLAAAAS